MPGCCSHFECSASQQFNQKKVTQELKRYREKGSGPTTRLLIEGITKSGALGGTVLDVGSGIGGLTLALLERGASSAVAVDASGAYVSAARDEADRRGRAEAIRFIHADFVMAASELSSASIVTRRHLFGLAGVFQLSTNVPPSLRSAVPPEDVASRASMGSPEKLPQVTAL